MIARESNRVTIHDVARHAGVSIATVSRVLNKSTLVADRTRIRVHHSIDQLQFRPDRTARALAGRKIESLVVALPTFTTPFHNELLKGVREAIGGSNLELLIWDLEWRDAGSALARFLSRGSVSGLLLVGMMLDERSLREVTTVQAPIVLVGAQSDRYDSFYWDDVAGSRLAVSHLIEQGHDRIGLIMSSTQSEIQARRLQGYREALETHGKRFDSTLVAGGRTEKHAGFSEEAGFEAMQLLLERAPELSAVFASSDVQAIGAIKALGDAGKTVPGDVAVIGYDDIKVSRFVGLTSVDQRAQEVGHRAASVLLRRIAGHPPTSSMVEHIVPRLRIRSSSMVAARRRPHFAGLATG